MVEIIEDILDTIDNLPSWGKILGVSGVIGFIALFAFLMFLAQQPNGNEAVKVPSTIKEIKENVTTTLVDTGVDTSKTVSGEVITTFNKAGKDLAGTVNDKAVGVEIVILMTFAGFLLAGALVMAIMKPILEIVKSLGNALPF